MGSGQKLDLDRCRQCRVLSCCHGSHCWTSRQGVQRTTLINLERGFKHKVFDKPRGRANSDLWARAGACIRSRDGNLDVMKVKAHVNLASGDFPWHERYALQHYLGNSLADVVVGMAAEAAQVHGGQKAAYLAERAVHRNVLRRAIAARMQVFAGRRAKSEQLRVKRLS